MHAPTVSWPDGGKPCTFPSSRRITVIERSVPVNAIASPVTHKEIGSGTLMWDIADTLNGLMAIPNFVALFALSPVVFKLTKEYFANVDKNK